MGKKGSWFSAIKRVFTPKDKPVNENDTENNSKEKKKKKKGFGKLRHGETNSFIPLFREPSSIEKIFGDFEREQQRSAFRPPQSPDQPPKTSSFVTPRVASSPRVVSTHVTSPRAPSPRAVSPRVASPRVASPRARSPRVANHHHEEISYRPEPTLRYHHASATRIQAAYRAYMARRSFRALKGLVRLQGVVRGQNVKRQTVNAMKYMQLLVRVQSQIQSRRIQMLESQARRHAQNKDADAAFGKWNLASASEAGNGDWDDSVLTKEEVDTRMQKKVEAIVKRERAMAYAYSHQLWKASPKSDETPLAGGFPWWYNWLERQLPSPLTPPRPSSGQRLHRPLETMDTATPRSSKSTMAFPTRLPRTPTPTRTPLSSYSRPRGSNAASGAESPFQFPARDNESLTSCPPFSVPNYMAPTVSAKAKVRPTSNPKERFMATPDTTDSKRRLSFPLTHGIGSFKWNKSPSFFSANNNATPTTSRKTLDKHHSALSVGNTSVDSTVSMPAAMGRKPFNRYV